jgi:Leucine Rich repeat
MGSCCLQTGINYIAQVLKRNRTLKVLNLSENKLDVPCLVAIAEALVSICSSCCLGVLIVKISLQKYNSCLETLDLSRNPCCGPGLEGVGPNSLLHRFSKTLSDSISPHGIHLKYCFEAPLPLLHLNGFAGCHRPSGVPPRVDVTPASGSDGE